MNGHSLTKRLGGLRSILGAGCVYVLLCVTSCVPKIDTDALTKQLTQRDDQWSKSAATRNADTLASYYAPDAIAYPPNEPAAIGQEAAKKVWASYFVDSTFSISWQTDHAGVAKSGDLGFTAGSYEDSFQGSDGKMVNEKGKYVCVWAKQPDGTWKAIHDIWNADTK